MTAARKKPTPAVSCRSLEVSYGHVVALKGVDIEVPARKLTTVIGPNGAGKTTLLKTICGLEHPSGGQLMIDGEPIGQGHKRTSPEEMLASGVALVPEGRHVFPHLSVRDNLELGAFVDRKDKATVKRRMEQAYGWFPLLEPYGNRLAGTLSGGEQQMLAIARALMSEPWLLCLDEPSLGLAPKVVKQVLQMLRSMCDRGTTVLLVEQFAYLALQEADHAYLLENGSIGRAGSGAELLSDGYVQASYLGVGAARTAAAPRTSPKTTPKSGPRTTKV
jgi:branched-chain amino acid transport system ATP-binding protein